MKDKLPVTPAYLPVQGKQRKIVFPRKTTNWIIGPSAASTLLCALISLDTGIPFVTVVSKVWVAFLLLVLGLAIVFRLYGNLIARQKSQSTPGKKTKKTTRQKAKHGIDVTLDEKAHIYRIQGNGDRTGGRALLDLADAYELRYRTMGDTSLDLRLYDMYTQQDAPDWQHIATGTGTNTFYLEKSRYEFIVKTEAEDRRIDHWELELESIYGLASIDEAEEM